MALLAIAAIDRAPEHREPKQVRCLGVQQHCTRGTQCSTIDERVFPRAMWSITRAADWRVATNRPLACNMRSALDGREIESAETLGISKDVHLDDLAVRNRESDHGKQATIREVADETDVAIHQHYLIGQSDLRERRCLCQDRLSPTNQPRHALQRSAIRPQDDIRIE